MLATARFGPVAMRFSNRYGSSGFGRRFFESSESSSQSYETILTVPSSLAFWTERESKNDCLSVRDVENPHTWVQVASIRVLGRDQMRRSLVNLSVKLATIGPYPLGKLFTFVKFAN